MCVCMHAHVLFLPHRHSWGLARRRAASQRLDLGAQLAHSWAPELDPRGLSAQPLPSGETPGLWVVSGGRGCRQSLKNNPAIRVQSFPVEPGGGERVIFTGGCCL